MIQYFRSHLVAKIFLTYLIVILVGMLVLVSATQFALPTAFDRHMSGMVIAPGGMGIRMTGPFIMGGQANGPVTMQVLYPGFRASTNEALLWAILAAGLLALIVSVVLSRRIVAPLQAIMSASQRVADGQYNERVKVTGMDELGQLAARFNQMAGKLEQIETMRRQLIGDVAHELRTPLTTIKGSMEGLQDGVLPATQETYQQIYREADRLSLLVDDLQELSRVESGSLKLDLRPMPLTDLVNTVLKRLGRQFEEKGVSLTSGRMTDLPLVLVDEDRIGQVLLNLAGNALQYTPKGGSVLISAERENEEIRISVVDSGIGIPMEQLTHVFDRFYRVDKSRSRRAGGGSGIGLTIAKSLVEAHAGSIWVESAGEGKGSTFFFTLPVAR
jgi:two-component system, OmpR family, sensor histidine kinase BaeS